MNLLSLINFAFVLLFGIFLTLSFAGVRFSDTKRRCCATYLLLLALQVGVYFLLGPQVLFKTYPLVIHLPLFLILVYYFKCSPLMSVISVLSAYLFTIPRKWLGTLVASFFANSSELSLIVQIAVTIPLLLLVVKTVSPHIRKIRLEDRRVQIFFVAISSMYYIYDYVITVYSNLMYRGSPAMAEWMSTMIVIMYFVFSILYIKIISRHNQLQVEKLVFEASANQAKKEIYKYQQAQEKLAVYRHDMHHHLQYISSCISKGENEKAQQYIHSISQQINDAKVTHYCNCETLDLLLSTYIERAESSDIRCDVKIQISSDPKLPEIDLCSLFANIFENAINANKAISDYSKRYIAISVHTKNDKLCICISNPYNGAVAFENNLPQSAGEGHGYGAKSILMVVEKFGGVCQFKAEDGVFQFTAVI